MFELQDHIFRLLNERVHRDSRNSERSASNQSAANFMDDADVSESMDSLSDPDDGAEGSSTSDGSTMSLAAPVEGELAPKHQQDSHDDMWTAECGMEDDNDKAKAKEQLVAMLREAYMRPEITRSAALPAISFDADGSQEECGAS